ncbi:uncharacterized protein LY79DRAFT_561901, partial [Colletotrichum navitas]
MCVCGLTGLGLAEPRRRRVGCVADVAQKEGSKGPTLMPGRFPSTRPMVPIPRSVSWKPPIRTVYLRRHSLCEHQASPAPSSPVLGSLLWQSAYGQRMAPALLYSRRPTGYFSVQANPQLATAALELLEAIIPQNHGDQGARERGCSRPWSKSPIAIGRCDIIRPPCHSHSSPPFVTSIIHTFKAREGERETGDRRPEGGWGC